MEIKKQLITQDKYDLKCPYELSPKFIVVHNTGMNVSAQREIDYMKSNDSVVSFHIAVDDKEAINGIPLNRNCWHAGDGENGYANRNAISIEICHSTGDIETFKKAEINGAMIIAQLLKEYGLGIDKVRKHKDFSSTDCPHRTCELGWDRFVNMVKLYLNGSSIDISKPNEIQVKNYEETGTFTCGVDKLDFYDSPNSVNARVTGCYLKGQSVNYDRVYITDKYAYIHWISASTGEHRYMPVRDLSTRVLRGTIV